MKLLDPIPELPVGSGKGRTHYGPIYDAISALVGDMWLPIEAADEAEARRIRCALEQRVEIAKRGLMLYARRRRDTTR